MCMCGYRTSIRLQIHATVHSPESTLVNNSTVTQATPDRRTIRHSPDSPRGPRCARSQPIVIIWTPKPTDVHTWVGVRLAKSCQRTRILLPAAATHSSTRGATRTVHTTAPTARCLLGSTAPRKIRTRRGAAMRSPRCRPMEGCMCGVQTTAHATRSCERCWAIASFLESQWSPLTPKARLRNSTVHLRLRQCRRRLERRRRAHL